MAGLIPFRRNSSLMNSRFPDFYDMLDDFFGDNWWPRKPLTQETFKIDVQDNENEYIVEAELPGVRKDEITVEMNDGRLTIFVKKEEAVEEERKNYIHRERRYSSMSRGIYLVDAQSEGIKARLDNGILSITVPKQDRSQNKSRIEIE